MSSPVLQVRDLSKRFGQVVVADALNLTVERGDTIGIVGPNGAGKSSFFNLITGDLTGDRGTIEFEGTDVTHQRPFSRIRAGMGRTYQIPRPFEKMTVLENALVGAQQGAGLRGRAALLRAAEALDITGLSSVANQPAGSLRLLDRKRLEVSRAWATVPQLLLFDEIAGGLTEPEVQALVVMVREIRRTGITIVWVEHVVQALMATVDRMLCLASGRIVADGTPGAVMADSNVKELYLGIALEDDDAVQDEGHGGT
jgi:branched-chain amino acid transport system ATP-binding protein